MTTREQYMLMGPAGVIHECENLEGELAAVRTALNDSDLARVGTLADRILALTHHHREWKSMFADVSNRLAAETDYAEALQQAARDVVHFWDRLIRYVPIDSLLGSAIISLRAALAKNPNPAGSRGDGQPSASPSGPVDVGTPQTRTEIGIVQPDVCPECKRRKARNVQDVADGLCPKWWAIRDPDALLDCEKHANPCLAVGLDSDARWKEVQAICDRVARADGMPDEVGSALCWAVTQLRESCPSQVRAQEGPIELAIWASDDGVEDNTEFVAQVSGPREMAMAEARRYAAPYAQDGDRVVIEEVTRREVEVIPSRRTAQVPVQEPKA